LQWHGLIDFPEMVDEDIGMRFGDRGVLVAPDGDYRFHVTVNDKEGKALAKTVPVEVESEIRR
ncbi:MAG: PKD domain-containing protein, partial [Rubrobacteridae bacterium]|nr:PKD domain-containing protein [Rubrobacteridae bacterium]